MMKRIFQFLSVLLVCLTVFLTVGCTVTTYYTYEAKFLVAPIAQDNTVRSEHYDFEQMMAFLDKMYEEESYRAELATIVTEKLGENAQGTYPSLEERIKESFSVGFENNINFTLGGTGGTEVNATIVVRVAAAKDENFRNVLSEAIKATAEAYIEANLPYPSDCIGTYCEFVSDQKGSNTQLDIGF